MKKIKMGIVVVFCLMLSGGSLATLLLPRKEYSVVENRELAQKPALTKKDFLDGSYQSQYETYLSDQLCFRDQWVDLAVNLELFLGKKDINGVYLGKEGYLLEKNEKTEFDDGQVQENIESLSTFLNDAVEVYGENHVSCMMIPSKAEVMTNRLPSFATPLCQDAVLVSLQQELSAPEILLDVCEELKKHQEEYIYYRTDHHWTTLGAYYAYAKWAEETGQASAFALDHYRREEVFNDFYGTTYNKVHVKVPVDCVELFHNSGEEGLSVTFDDEEKSDTMYFCKEASKGFNRYNVFFSKNTFQVEVNTKAKTEKTLLVIKDSFANCFVPFLTEDYERIIMIDYRYGKTPIGSIMSQYEDITDVLVMFNTQKFMQNTKLGKLAETGTDEKEETMEEFHMEDLEE